MKTYYVFVQGNATIRQILIEHNGSIETGGTTQKSIEASSETPSQNQIETQEDAQTPDATELPPRDDESKTETQAQAQPESESQKKWVSTMIECIESRGF